MITYGTAAEADFRLEFLEFGKGLGPQGHPSGAVSRFMVHSAQGPLGPFELHKPGRHNVLNATAAVWRLRGSLKCPRKKLRKWLKNFRGVDRSGFSIAALCAA